MSEHGFTPARATGGRHRAAPDHGRMSMTLRKAIVSIMAMGVMMLGSSCGIEDDHHPSPAPTTTNYYPGYAPPTTASKPPVTRAPAAPPVAPKAPALPKPPASKKV